MSDNKTAHIHIDTNRIISPVSPLLFSGFAEHMGRCIYGGIYEPGSPRADENTACAATCWPRCAN